MLSRSNELKGREAAVAKSDDDREIDPRIEYLGDLAFDGEFCDTLDAGEFPDDRDEAQVFLSKHQRLSESELERRYQKALQEQKEREREAREKRKQHCDHWASAKYWTLDEAAALVVGQAPDSDPLKFNRITLSDFGIKTEKEGQVYNLAKRHRNWSEKNARIDPGDFIDWVKLNGFSCPADLKKALQTQGYRRIDWRQRYEDFQAKLQKGEERIAQLGKEKLELTKRVETLERDTSQALGTRERETILKIIAAMAVHGYRFDPRNQRNEATTDILKDLAKLGLTLDPKTIRKKLSDACELIDQDVLADLS